MKHLFPGLTRLVLFSFVFSHLPVGSAGIAVAADSPAGADQRDLKSQICVRVNNKETGTPEQNWKKLHDQWDAFVKEFTVTHAQLPETTKGKAVVEERVELLKRSFGGVCEAKKNGAEKYAEYSAKMASLQKEGLTTTACGSFNVLETSYTNAKQQYKAFSDMLKDKVIPALRKSHVEQANRHGQLLRDYAQKAKTETDISKLTEMATRMDKLRSEYGAFWSHADLSPVTDQTIKANTAGMYFERIIYLIELEQRGAESIMKTLDSEANRIATKKADCASLPGVEAPPTTEEELPPTTGEQEDPGTGKGDVETPGKIDDQVPPPGDDDDDDDDDGGKDRKQAEEDEKKPGFFKRNAGTIAVVGVGAAAVGGLIYYKKQQDKKANQSANNMDMEAMAIATGQRQTASNSSSGSSGSSNNGGPPPSSATPPGSTLAISGVPAGATVGENLTELTVSVISPSGILTQDSSTDITVDCATPSPCHIEGTLTARTSGGKAVFNNFYFTASDSGVKLRFSAPGFATVTSGNSFNVTAP